MYRSRGFGDVPAGMVDCGGGLSVSQGTPCPATPVYTPTQQAALAQAQVDYNARAARCKVYQTQQYAITFGAAGAAAFLLPGWWKALSVVVAIVIGIQYPHSVDCDYGM